jgi:signal peptidase II
MSTKFKIVAILAPLLLVLDQLSKWWVVSSLKYQGGRLSPSTMSALESWGHNGQLPTELPVLPGFLSFVHRQNPGAAFGMLVDFEHRMLVFGAFTVVAVGVLVSMYRSLEPGDRLQSTIVAMIASGAAGNAFDRMHKATVTDFVKVYSDHPGVSAWLVETFGTDEYPTFNIADSCIVVGVCLYLLHYLLVAFERPTAVSSEDAGESPLSREDSPST